METKFIIQKAGSQINWTGKKVLGLHTGTIELESGHIHITNELISGGKITIDMSTIQITDISDQKTAGQFHAHLLNDDFFAVDQFKTADLTISGSESLGNNKQTVSGLLTIKGITQPVEFTTTCEQFTDFLHATGEIIIDRTRYNIRYGSGKFFDNLGDSLIHDHFVLQFKLIGQKAI